MADLPQLGLRDEVLEDFGGTGSSTGTTITASATANTKGSYTQLVASTSRHASAVSLWFQLVSGVADFLVDVAIGGSGSEQALIENLMVNRGSIASAMCYTRIPVAVPSGTRIAARCQSTDASATVILRGCLHCPGANSMPGFQHAKGVGVNTADSGGTGIDGGATANTKGAYAELVASTAEPYRCFYVMLGQQDVAARTAANFLVDIAIGAASSESVIVPNIGVATDGQEFVRPQVSGPFYLPIPSGTRVAARCQCSSATDGTRDIDVALLGVY